jgi:hypothetical protein
VVIVADDATREPSGSTVPEPGTDSRVEDWYGQSVQRDTELAEELTQQLGEEEAEQVFEQRATGRAEQEARHGDTIDPDQGRSAYEGRSEGGQAQR